MAFQNLLTELLIFWRYKHSSELESRHLKVALGPYEFSAKFRVAEKKLGQNSAVQIDRRNFCMSREFAGGATHFKVTESEILLKFRQKFLLNWKTGQNMRSHRGVRNGQRIRKKLNKMSSKVTYAREFWPRKFKYRGGIISWRRREKYRTQKFEFVTEVAVPFFRLLVAPHVGQLPVIFSEMSLKSPWDFY